MNHHHRQMMATLVVSALLLSVSPLLAQGADGLPPEMQPPMQPPIADGYQGPLVSVTISPIHLALPVFEVTAEYRIEPRVGVAAVAGYGNVSTAPEGGGEDISVAVFEIGAQANYYLLGDFDHGLQLGAEVLYIGGSAEEGNVSAVASGLAMGPFAGYKVAADFGLTFVFQLGAQFVTLKADAEATTGETATKSESNTIALLNINLGWSF